MALRIIQVGLGGWGRDWAQRVVPQIEAVQLVGSVDPDPAALAKVTGPAPCFGSLSEALQQQQTDAVLVTAAVAGHVDPVRTALSAGKHVLVEKPFAPTMAEATELVALAADRGVRLMVSQNYRYFPAPRAVQALVAAGELGALHHVDVDFRRHSRPTPRPGPHHAYAQPLLDDMSIHHFDLLRFVVGQPAAGIVCQAWNPSWSGFAGPPVATALIQLGADVHVSYRGSWISRRPPTAWAGEWQMSFERGDVSWTSRGDGDTPAVDRVSVTIDGVERALELTPLRWTDRWGTLSEFAAAVAEDREPECSGADNLGSLALRTAAITSADTGQPVSLVD